MTKSYCRIQHLANFSGSLDKRRYLLDLEKLARERVAREDARIGQAITWLFASQALLGGSYAYLKQQVALAMQSNLRVTWQSLTFLVKTFPFAAISISIVFFLTVLSVSVTKREIQFSYPQLSLLGNSWFTRVGPVGAPAIGVLFAIGWYFALLAIP